MHKWAQLTCAPRLPKHSQSCLHELNLTVIREMQTKSTISHPCVWPRSEISVHELCWGGCA